MCYVNEIKKFVPGNLGTFISYSAVIPQLVNTLPTSKIFAPARFFMELYK